MVKSVAVLSTLSLLTHLQALGSFAMFFLYIFFPFSPFTDNISKSVMMLGLGSPLRNAALGLESSRTIDMFRWED